MSYELVEEPREKINDGKKGKWRIPIIITEIVILAVVVIGGIMIAAHNGLFLSDKDKVLLALTNTLTENDEIEDFISGIVSISGGEEYNISFKSEREGDYAFMEYGHTKDGKQLHLETELGGIFDMEITGFVDDSQMKLMHSDVKNVILLYNYTEENKGYLFQNVIPKDVIEDLNASIAAVYEAGQKSESSNGGTSVEAIASTYRKMEFEKAADRSFEINGVSTLCKGYTTILDKDIDGIIAIEKGSEVTFYIDDEYLAGIIIKNAETEMKISFLGGDYRLQNIAIYEDKEAFLELEIKSMDTQASSVALDAEARINWERLEKMDTTGALKLLRYAKADGALADKWSNISFVMDENVDLAKFDGITIDIGNASLVEMGKTILELIKKYAGEWL